MIISILLLNIKSFSKEKVILYFDVNKTIIADDPASNKTVEYVLNHCLAEKYKDRWDAAVQEPISYSDYVKIYLLPGKNSDSNLKALRNQKISGFLQFLEEKQHPFEKEIKTQYSRMKEKLSENNRAIFPSFYHLIDHLKKEGVDFSIIVRTFGQDLERVTQEIQKVHGDGFFTATGKYKEGKLFFEEQNLCLDTPLKVYEFLKTHSHAAIQDNWKEWNSHDEHQEFGKQFPVDTEDSETISIFFDDNVIEDPNSEENIVNPVDVKTGSSLNVSSLVKSKNIVVVDTIEAILDDDYFIKKVRAASKSENLN